MSHCCAACRRRLSVHTRTVMERSRIPLRKWAIGIYFVVTNLKGVSSMKLHRELNVTQKSAWFMLHRTREAMDEDVPVFIAPVEVDELYVRGFEHNKHVSRRLNRKRRLAASRVQREAPASAKWRHASHSPNRRRGRPCKSWRSSRPALDRSRTVQSLRTPARSRQA